ncbi:substrate-binding periplasmic protein [Roseateles sp. DB2]|uniref:substrate-binding periplasmic protein n=1 Tax=Roseateles sp. DB2 TaxID=3453717 RepID=UPI003EEB3B31
MLIPALTRCRLLRHGLVLLLGLALAQAQALELRLCQTDSPRYDYRLALTRLLLEKTAQRGESSTLSRHGLGADPSQDRCLELLRSGEVDLVYLPPNPARMAEFAVLPIDLHAGRLGYRLLLIRKEDAPRFARVHRLDQLRSLTGGFGRQWADLAVFEANGLPVVAGPGTEALLGMLRARRFDYLQRGVSEAYAELASFGGDSDLMVEPHLALLYALPVYFMVRKDRRPLLQRLQRGLQLAQQDGSFRRLLDQHQGRDWARAAIERRQVLELKSPWPELTPPSLER